MKCENIEQYICLCALFHLPILGSQFFLFDITHNWVWFMAVLNTLLNDLIGSRH